MRYRVESKDAEIKDEDLQTFVNEQADEGWRLVAVCPSMFNGQPWVTHYFEKVSQ